MSTNRIDTADRAYARPRTASAGRPSHQAATHKEFAELVQDAEDLVNNTVDTMGAQTAAARAQLQNTLARARERMGTRVQALADRSREIASVADDYVRERPWQMVGIGAAAGLAIGFLVARR